VMHSDKQNLFLTTFKKWVLAKKSGQIPHSAPPIAHFSAFPTFPRFLLATFIIIKDNSNNQFLSAAKTLGQKKVFLHMPMEAKKGSTCVQVHSSVCV